MAFSTDLEFFLHADPDEVMELLTNPVFIEEWSGKKAVFEKQANGAVEMFDGWMKGKVIAISADELVFSWKPAEWDEATVASEVFMKLVPAPHGTEIFVKHGNLPTQEAADGYTKGWDEFFFGPVGEYLANRRL